MPRLGRARPCFRRLAPACAALAVLGGCGDNLAAPADDPLRQGGSRVPPGCDHRVVTRVGATAPALPGAEVGVDPTPRLIHLGLAGDARTSMVVTWRTRDEATTAGAVRFGTLGTLDREAPGLTFTYRADFGEGDVVRIHEAHLCGLAADTTYAYEIVSGGATSPRYEFRTAPEPTPDAEVTIGAAGDSRGGYEVWGRLANQLAARAPDLLVWSGDTVLIGALQAEWDEFFAAGEPLMARVPTVAVAGNHEINAINHFAQFALPGDEENFDLTYGPVHLVLANDSPTRLADLDGTTREFLRSALAGPASPWTIVDHHRPIYSASFHGSDLALRASWGPIFEGGNVDLVINGHEHSYERSLPMQAGAPAATGPVYVVAGGAGAPLVAGGRGAWTAVARDGYGAVVVRARPGLLRLEAFDPDGVTFDQLTLTKP